MTVSPHLGPGNDVASHEAKAGIAPVPKAETSPKRARRRKPLRRVVVMEGAEKRVKRRLDKRQVLWHRAIRGSVCVACQRRPAIEAHHIIRVQVLRRYAAEHGYDFEEVRFDSRNRLGLCRDCHAGHHSGMHRLSHDLLWRYARWVYRFAEELGLEWSLERDYIAAVCAAACRTEETAA